MKTELLKGLSEEQIAKASKCKSTEELLELAKKEGFELTEEQLQAVNGGACVDAEGPSKNSVCPACETPCVGKYRWHSGYGAEHDFICPTCGCKWTEKNY